MTTLLNAGFTRAPAWTVAGAGRMAAAAAAMALHHAASTLMTWHARAVERRQLASLDERMRHDIGLTAVDLWHETNKPFWRP